MSLILEAWRQQGYAPAGDEQLLQDYEDKLQLERDRQDLIYALKYPPAEGYALSQPMSGSLSSLSVQPQEGAIVGPSAGYFAADSGAGTYEDPRATSSGGLTVHGRETDDVPDWQFNNAGNGLKLPGGTRLDGFGRSNAAPQSSDPTFRTGQPAADAQANAAGAQDDRNEFDRQDDRYVASRNDARKYGEAGGYKLTKFQDTYLHNNLQSLAERGVVLSENDAAKRFDRARQLAELGSVSERFETGGRGPGVVSSGGGGDKGGVSYGSYQLASNAGNPQKFLANEGARWAGQFVKMDSQKSDGDFAKTWKAVAAAEPDDFHAAQHAFIERTHYEGVLKMAHKLGFNIADVGVQNALWSQSVQSSPDGNNIMLTEAAKAKHPSDLTPAQQIDALYDARTEYAKKIKIKPESAGAPRYAQERPVGQSLSSNFPLDK